MTFPHVFGGSNATVGPPQASQALSAARVRDALRRHNCEEQEHERTTGAERTGVSSFNTWGLPLENICNRTLITCISIEHSFNIVKAVKPRQRPSKPPRVCCFIGPPGRLFRESVSDLQGEASSAPAS